MEHLLLTPEEAAEVLHVGRTTLYGLLRDGVLRAVHIGRSCRVPHGELVRYVAALTLDAESPEELAPAQPTPIARRPRRKRTASADQTELFAQRDAARPQAG
jgi:excisionase family DNA binding protein